MADRPPPRYAGVLRETCWCRPRYRAVSTVHPRGPRSSRREFLPSERCPAVSRLDRADEAGHRFVAFSCVDIGTSLVPGSVISRFSTGTGRGVVVTSCRGSAPSRSPNCSMSNVSSACFHLVSSSHQAKWNCPRSASGSPEEKICAMRRSTRRAGAVISRRSAVSSELSRRCPKRRRSSPRGHRSAFRRQRDPETRPLVGRSQRMHPFGPCACLTRTAPAHDQPVPPVFFGWLLFAAACLATTTTERRGMPG